MKLVIIFATTVLIATVWASPLESSSVAASGSFYKDSIVNRIAREAGDDSEESKEEGIKITSDDSNEAIKNPIATTKPRVSVDSGKATRKVTQPTVVKSDAPKDSKEASRKTLKRLARDIGEDSDESREIQDTKAKVVDDSNEVLATKPRVPNIGKNVTQKAARLAATKASVTNSKKASRTRLAREIGDKSDESRESREDIRKAVKKPISSQDSGSEKIKPRLSQKAKLAVRTTRDASEENDGSNEARSNESGYKGSNESADRQSNEGDSNTSGENRDGDGSNED